MDARIATAAVIVLLLGGTAAIYIGARKDPEHDEARVVAELAKVETSDAVPSDVHLPEVLRAASCVPGTLRHEAERLHAPKCPIGGGHDHLNLTLSPTVLRVAGLASGSSSTALSSSSSTPATDA